MWVNSPFRQWRCSLGFFESATTAEKSHKKLVAAMAIKTLNTISFTFCDTSRVAKEWIEVSFAAHMIRIWY